MIDNIENDNDQEDFNDILNFIDSLDGDKDVDYGQISNFLGIDFDELQKNIYDESVLLDLSYSKSNENAVDPEYAYPTDSGFDLYSTEEVLINPFDRELVPTGLHFDIHDGYEIQVRSKSGLALKDGLMVLNSPGTVDQGYTGEIKVILFNTTNQPKQIKKGQKIAQAVVCPVVSGKWIKLTQKDTIEPKDRNYNGFGSTGV